MTSKAGHTFTAGPWEVVPLSGCGGPYAIRMAYMSDNPRASKTYYGVQGVGTEANARLIAEAGTILHETGLTPRQLAERCKELETALAFTYADPCFPLLGSVTKDKVRAILAKTGGAA